ncbi:hypothetical protein BaRGS_00038169 [Batillaria attramentaria]|uniref:Uncharacterized protein n=1 Tax=Batillaria attramentaria TaxID=370345 RepID=A0ABD0J6K8_9CAEN
MTVEPLQQQQPLHDCTRHHPHPPRFIPTTDTQQRPTRAAPLPCGGGVGTSHPTSLFTVRRLSGRPVSFSSPCHSNPPPTRSPVASSAFLYRVTGQR